MKLFSPTNRVLQGLQVILLAAFAVGAPMSAAPNNDVEKLEQSYSFEFLTFKGDTPPQTFLEVFCQIPAAQKFQFIKVIDGFVATYEIAITILDAQNTVVANLQHADSVKVGAYSEIFLPWEPQLIRFTFLLNPGDYLAQVRIVDRKTLADFHFNKKITLPNFFDSSLKLSSLQLSSSIEQSAGESVLVKNNLKIIPNVPHLFGFEYTTLYFYSEIYNLDFAGPKPFSAFNVTATVFDQNGQAVKTLKQTYPKPAAACVLSFGIPIADLGLGNYRLVIAVEDINSGAQATQAANFVVLAPSPISSAKTSTASGSVHSIQ